MTCVTASKGNFNVSAYVGDAKTLLAFNLSKAATKNLAGFTIRCQPAAGAAFYLLNTLQFAVPNSHAADAAEPATSSLNAPFQKFRWLHVLAQAHQGLTPSFGTYTYTVTPRYFDGGAMQALDQSLSVEIKVPVGPFRKASLALGFTRGFVQSQAFVHHFGYDALIRPAGKALQFDTAAPSGSNAQGDHFTYADEYAWLGYTARTQIFGVLNAVVADKSLSLDVFAYDLNEPDIVALLLKLAGEGRIRIILDNSTEHHASPPKPEDQFATLFAAAAKKGAAIKRGKFGRFAHDKVFIVSKAGKPAKVLTGSTNFSVTGLYVNSNHVLLFDDATIAATYADIFQASWDGDVAKAAFLKSPDAAKSFSFAAPAMAITFSPHDAAFTTQILGGLAQRIAQEGQKGKKKGDKKGSVLFAVMALSGGGPVFPALNAIHANTNVFSFGISDGPQGISLYAPGKSTGVLVSGKPGATVLPPPFDKVAGIGAGHQVHHKFVVCGFNDDDAVVYCGSSNLAAGGEENNGDNLLAIRDKDVATAFAIEAVGLVDHFNFLDSYADKAKQATGKNVRTKKPAASKTQAATSVGWYLHTDGQWATSYYDPKDLHCADRLLFAD